MYTYTWYQWLAFFYVYCFLGWIFESTYVSLKQKRLVNRGFLRLPMLPLYGSGAVMMLWVSLPVRDSLPLVYISGFIAATALEYVTGAVMERLFKVRYWDYSSQPFQLHGYICLSSSIAWGFLTILMTDVIHDPIARTVLAVPPVILLICDFVISVLFTADAYESIKAALALGHTLEAMTKLKADIEELQSKIELLREEAIERGALTREETAEKLAAAQAEAARRLAAVRSDAEERLAETKALAEKRLSDVREETTSRIEAAKAGNAERIEAAKQRVNERIAEVRTEVDARIAFDNRLTRLSTRLEELKHRRQSLRPAKKLHAFYRRGLLRGNPTAVSSKFAAALKELKEQNSTKIGPFA
ncbi:putative ABC transporter permease [Clostridium fessum]|uniref:putative ABC transporter permease n=1 Tax=Clostridium fessum TaxID=2126740 RepID=UPI003AB3571C